MEFKNQCTKDVYVNVYIDTGFTGIGNCAGAAPFSAAAPACDTFWENGWALIKAGKKKKFKLDFNNATAFNFSDDPITPGVDGIPQAIIRLDEVSNFGFQVANFTGDPVDALFFIKSIG